MAATTTSDVTTSDVVAQNIVKWRKRKGLSARKLAQQCQDTGGYWISESVIRNLETGRPVNGHRRRKVDVDDVVAIATALDIPAMFLMPVYLDQDAEGITIDFPNHQQLERFLAALKITLAGLRKLEPFLPKE